MMGYDPQGSNKEADMAILRYTFSVVLEKLTESQKYKSQQSVSGKNMNWLCCIYDLEVYICVEECLQHGLPTHGLPGLLRRPRPH